MYVVSFSFYQKKKISVSDWKRFHEAFSQCISVTNWWDHVRDWMLIRKKLMYLLIVTGKQNVSLVTGVPVCCLSLGARLCAEADAPSQWKHGGSWWCGRGGRSWGRCVPSAAVPPAYCNAQQHLPTPHPVSAGEQQHYMSLKATAGLQHTSAKGIGKAVRSHWRIWSVLFVHHRYQGVIPSDCYFLICVTNFHA